MAQGWKLYLERSQGSLVFKYQRRQDFQALTAQHGGAGRAKKIGTVTQLGGAL